MPAPLSSDEALAITGECSVAGVVQAHMAAKGTGLKLLIGTELRLADGRQLILIAPHRRAHAQMCALISLGRSLAPKGRYRLTKTDVEEAVPDCLTILYADHQTAEEAASWLAEHFGDRGRLGVSQLRAWLRPGGAAGVFRNEHQRFCRTLSDEHPIEGVAMVGRRA